MIEKNRFANLVYMFACTCHKSQGSTYNSVYVDANDMSKYEMYGKEMMYRLAYVSITRSSDKILILV